ncbi:MAG TPA: ABC transporter permease [Candidatus Limnocylindria bacterium]|nr:ABC transporter permease [Candidatus Limnocylindria bacterium]
MNLRESVGIALDALRANALRSLLTLVGVIIGVSSVIAVISLVQGLDRYVASQLSQAGADVFSIDKIGVEFDFTKIAEKERRPDLTPADAEAIARAASHAAAAVAERTTIATVRRASRSLNQVQVRGVGADYMLVTDLPVARGRPLHPRDQQSRSLVCVIGDEIAEQLFGPADPLGREIRVGEARCTVVGVGERKGSAFGQSQDLYVLLPFTTFLKLYGRDQSVTISVRARGRESFEQAQDEARAILRARRHVRPAAADDFEIVTPEMYLSLWRNLSGAIFIVIVGVSTISLVVGGIVIMNIMLVSVTERTREIGVRKAIGARSRDILSQFLVEAVTLSCVGGAIGLVLGVLGAVAIGVLTPLPTYVSPLAIVLGLVTSTLVGVFFGAYPAARAARQDPIEALRYE